MQVHDNSDFDGTPKMQSHPEAPNTDCRTRTLVLNVLFDTLSPCLDHWYPERPTPPKDDQKLSSAASKFLFFT